MDDGRRDKKRKESSKHPKEISDRRDELRIFLFCSSDFSTFHHSLIHTVRALNGYIFLSPRCAISPMTDTTVSSSGRHFTESVSALHNATHLLSTRPELSPLFRLRLYPLSIERSSILAQLDFEERYAIECAQVAYDEERERVEEEWRKGRDRVRERLLEGIEERRRRAREEKEGEGTIGGQFLFPAYLALQTHIANPRQTLPWTRIPVLL